MTISRIVDSLKEMPAAQWDALHDGTNPFVAHAFLSGLEEHGCVREEWGWSPRHLTLWEGDQLVAAAPGYSKANSHGEYVFDHAWAHAYARAGLDYYPKWLFAAPYSPVTGPRLLSGSAAHQQALLRAMTQCVAHEGTSSIHVNFHAEQEIPVFSAEWLERIDVQYHWRNASGWTNFDEFLAAFDHKHRKNIRQERAKVAREGIRFRIVHGDEASESELATMHGFYLQTFAEYGNHPALTLSFFRHLARSLPRSLVLMLALRGDEPVAGAFCLRGGDTLYGRYWGAHEQVPGLHFETCYYQGIDYCLREGLTRFEPGAQGEHKLARGFLPVFVRSHHWIRHGSFREALREWCRQEADSVRRYAATLVSHSPFKAT